VTGPLPAAITAVLAVVVIGGAAIAVGSREQRPAILGLLVALSGAPFLADPMPDPRGIAARIASAALVAYLFLMATRANGDATDPMPSSGTAAASGPLPSSLASVAVPWPVALLVAATAAAVAIAAVLGSDLPGSAGLPRGAGLPGTSGVPEPPGAPLLAAAPFIPAAAAGAALVALAAAPILLATHPLRLAQALVLAGAGAPLVLASVTGPPSPFSDLCLALLLAVVAGAGGLLHTISQRSASQPAP
jgi:hypothetical protein